MIPKHIIPLLIGLLMASLDIGMMSVAKLTNLGRVPYLGGLAASTALYSLQPFLFLQALRFESMVAANLLWNLISMIVVTLIGVFFFNESIKGLRIVAILLGLLSIGLFTFTEE